MERNRRGEEKEDEGMRRGKIRSERENRGRGRIEEEGKRILGRNINKYM